MYRTDKQFMKDPATAASRIYIGSISDSVVPDNLEEKFKVHGKILGLVLQRGFGFIQYENETQAQTAIKTEHGIMFHGRKLIVRQAIDNKNKQNSNQPPTSTQCPQNKQPPPPPVQNKPPSQSKPPSETEVPIAPPPDVVNEAPVIEKRNKRKFWPRNNDRSQAADRQDYRDGPYYGMEESYGPAFVPPPILDRPERNDCEIIVVSKPLTEYAEYVEQRLKAMGLLVDLLFPNEDVPIGRVLANISSRGCLYAILIMPQNEEHRSLTLNILHGIPQEHRNMPIDDAVILITRNFDAYMRGEKLESDELASSLTDKHPEAMQMLFNLLAENRQLTSAQYDKLIKYLQERMELQKEYEGGEDIERGVQMEPNSKQAELQSRIMNILNKSASEPPKPIVPLTPSAPPGAPTPLLNDPSVQKALDSLLSGDMFKSISAGM